MRCKFLAAFLVAALLLLSVQSHAGSLSRVGPLAAAAVPTPAPRAEVIGPSEVDPGMPAVFMLKGVPTEHLDNFQWAFYRKPTDALVLDLADRAGNLVLIVWAKTATAYAVIADINIPGAYQLIVHEVVVGTPEPPPPPPPVDEVAFCVVVWEASDVFHQIGGKRINYGQILNSKSLRQTMPGRYYVIDQHATNLSPPMKAFIDRYGADKRSPLPWIYLVAKDGTVLHEERHPQTVKDSIALIEKFKE